MDPLTHGLLGATIGQAFAGRGLGSRAVLAGAVAAMAPDLDVIMGATGPMGEWLYHRGATHSLWLPVVLGPALGYAATRRQGKERRPAWSLLFVLAMLSHPLLDWCTSYGTQLLAPFSARRFAVDAVAIIDPGYSLVLLAALVVGAWRGLATRSAALASVGALVLTTAYLGHGLALNREAEAQARGQLAAEGVREAQVRAYPTLLQPYLRRLVVRHGDEVRVGWLSLWSPRPVEWRRFSSARDPLVQAARETEEGRILEWFAMGQTVAALYSSATGAVVEIDDLRYGFPSQPTEGLWGIRVRFDAEGRIEGRPDRIDRPLPASARTLLAQIFRQTFAPRR